MLQFPIMQNDTHKWNIINTLYLKFILITTVTRKIAINRQNLPSQPLNVNISSKYE
jgi:hypothetical protein